MNEDIIIKYFPNLTKKKVSQFEQLGELYPEWNKKINVISRKDIENLYERHILHSLAIARFVKFSPGTSILDAGTGGGFPGIPLAIFYPEAKFHLIDSTAKKLSVIEDISRHIGLKNVTIEHCRLESHIVKYDFIISRAVSTLENMIYLVGKNIRAGGANKISNGILYLKGGELEDEISKRGDGETRGKREWRYMVYPLSEYFKEPFFDTKFLIHLF